MRPEYLERLADIADPEQLWRRSGLEQMQFTTEQRQRLDTGVALRRHASHQRQLNSLIGTQQSLLISPFSENNTAVRTVPMPLDHKLLNPYAKKGD